MKTREEKRERIVKAAVEAVYDRGCRRAQRELILAVEDYMGVPSTPVQTVRVRPPNRKEDEE